MLYLHIIHETEPLVKATPQGICLGPCQDQSSPHLIFFTCRAGLILLVITEGLGEPEDGVLSRGLYSGEVWSSVTSNVCVREHACMALIQSIGNIQFVTLLLRLPL